MADEEPPQKRCKLQIEAPFPKDFKEYGIPTNQFVWGPHEESRPEPSFDDDETASPPSIPGPYLTTPRRKPKSSLAFRGRINKKPYQAPAARPRPLAGRRSQPKPSRRNKTKPPEKRGLLDLPAEIREEIYRGLLVSHKPIPVYDGWKRVYQREKPGLDISILMVCKKVFNEAIGVLYGENTFLYRLRDKPTQSHVMNNVHELARSNAYVPELGPRETYTTVFGDEDIRARAVHEAGTIDFKKYAYLFRYITLQADHNRYESYTMQFMADAIKMFAQEPGKTNIHTLTIIVSPQYKHGNFTFVDWFDSKSEIVMALKAVCCEIIRIKIWNKRLNDNIGAPFSLILLRAHQLRFVKQLRYQKIQDEKFQDKGVKGKKRPRRPDIWKGDEKMRRLRYKRLGEIYKKLNALRAFVHKACKKHLQPHVMRMGDRGCASEDEDEDDGENWDVIFHDVQAEDNSAAEDADDESSAQSEDNDSEYEE
ncbi:uncharacterized protein B0J16DRAFT_396713 [Fusarium flagelliforme]|uniref:Uncharacterized protein n=1 Tax=Fusarium flagelliforme TaxID=2675880 RepID=A0A395M8U0_9HYPO|nr:uncharacterized protein B0J16DRAFT_396713 [Fusarium flagelliforme]KAH7188577.1 hypothetical protein B0J16DRAFT_396713 [Fusarium flagelliforme]RFN43693.1 hypothetical protein FIE12Z_12067 [Fusarium flagelliforme]